MIGLSTHGLQWEGDYVHFETFEQIHSEFGINVIRLALYTSEGGYCEASITKKKELYDSVIDTREVFINSLSKEELEELFTFEV